MRKFAFLVSAVALVLLAAASLGYFILPGVLENRAADEIQNYTGDPAEVTIEVPFNFIFSGHVNRITIYSPTMQFNGLTVRQLNLEVSDLDISILSALQGKRFLNELPESSGTCIITASDLNNYLSGQLADTSIIIEGTEVYVETYRQGAGKIIVLGRFEANGDSVTFVPETLIEPKMLSLLLNSEMWKDTGFSISLNPAARVLDFYRVFVTDSHIQLYFRLKEGILEL